MANNIEISRRVLLELRDALRYGVCYDSVSTEVKQWQDLRIGNYLSGRTFQHDWRKVIGLCIALTFVSTYTITLLKSTIGLRSKKHGREPPIAPYWIPFLGNLLPLIWDPFTHCDETIKRYGYSTPVRLRLGPFKMYLVSGADHYMTLFSNKASRCMNTKGAVLLALENMFGTPSNVIPFYAADKSGVNSTPLPGSGVQPEHRITYLQVKAAHKHLSGTGLAQMTGSFLNILERRFSEAQVGPEWVDQPDLYAFLQNEVFRAAVEALCGPHLLLQSPTFVEDFWQFVTDVPTLIKGLPRWMSPGPYRNRQRLLDAVKKWHRYASEHSDFSRIGINDPEWEPYFGSKLIRARQEYSSKMFFMNKDALAAEDLGLIFATNTNAIPSLSWFIYEICRDPALMARVHREIDACRESSAESNKPVLDTNALYNQPLLQSIYAETLRLRVALIVTRTPEQEEFNVGQWTFPPKRVIALSSRTGAMNPNVWNAGTPEDPHPLDKFWADRFLIYPNDPMSGPLRKDQTDIKNDYMSKCISETKPAETGPRFSMEGVEGGWIPYGGGQRMCPGRHFAKQEIIGSLATLLAHFEIKLKEPKDGIEPECDMRYFPFGGLPPTKDIPFSLRRRQL
ncbi:hypothetical protein N7G274_002423 [Stereocaulon virgatum]|uniref:Cytochrome P450 n=1 Tax=Stereocaulon virgatum TaxID=373712 RepID=A0ABR4AIS0_9LECA